MGVQDRDYWKERYDDLNGRGRKLLHVVKPGATRPVSRYVAVAVLVLIVVNFGYVLTQAFRLFG